MTISSYSLPAVWDMLLGREVKRGFIAVKSNCSLQSYVPALHPLMKDFGVSKALVCTYQAISGAGKTFDRMPEIVDNVIPYRQKFSKDDHLIICIGRTQGSAGNDIGFALADALRINYYDAEIFNEVLRRLDAEKDSVTDVADLGTDLIENKYQGSGRTIKERLKDFDRYHGLTREDAIFFNQSDLICKMAKEEDFIVMGRCADVILANNHIPHISIFITAPFEQRVHRIMEVNDLDQKKAVRLLKKLDRQHARYYNYYTGQKWGDAMNYDICFNSASYGIEESVDIIERMLNQNTNS